MKGFLLKLVILLAVIWAVTMAIVVTINNA